VSRVLRQHGGLIFKGQKSMKNGLPTLEDETVLS
jgi:hypothetical protein